MPAIPPFDGADAAGADTETAEAAKRSLIVSVISCVLSFLSLSWAICTKVYDLHNKKSARKAAESSEVQALKDIETLLELSQQRLQEQEDLQQQTLREIRQQADNLQ